MSRCIVFDQTTADAVESLAGIRPQIRTDQPGTIISMAVKSGSAVAVVPALQPGVALVMRVSRPKPTQAPEKAAHNLAPTGFLGLSDSIDMDSEPEKPKNWWHKIIG